MVDVSGSMYRFNSLDGRLGRMMEAACLVMEAFHQFDNKIKVPVFSLYQPSVFCMPFSMCQHFRNVNTHHHHHIINNNIIIIIIIIIILIIIIIVNIIIIFMKIIKMPNFFTFFSLNALFICKFSYHMSSIASLTSYLFYV